MSYSIIHIKVSLTNQNIITISNHKNKLVIVFQTRNIYSWLYIFTDCHIVQKIGLYLKLLFTFIFTVRYRYITSNSVT